MRVHRAGLGPLLVQVPELELGLGSGLGQELVQVLLQVGVQEVGGRGQELGPGLEQWLGAGLGL